MATSTSKTTIGRTALIGLGLVLALAGCEGGGSQSGSSSTATSKNEDRAPLPSSTEKTKMVESQALPSAWPGPIAEDVDLEVAPQLTAKNYYVVLDGSGSMLERGCSGNQTKAQAAATALQSFAKAVPTDANLGLLIFDSKGVYERVGLGIDNRKEFADAVKASRPNGGTPLRSAIESAARKLELQGQRQFGYGEYHLVVVTDGAASFNEHPTKVVNDLLTESPITIHTIGFCIGTQHSLNQPGRVIYKAADNPKALTQGLGEVLAESETFDVDAFSPR